MIGMNSGGMDPTELGGSFDFSSPAKSRRNQEPKQSTMEVNAEIASEGASYAIDNLYERVNYNELEKNTYLTHAAIRLDSLMEQYQSLLQSRDQDSAMSKKMEIDHIEEAKNSFANLKSAESNSCKEQISMNQDLIVLEDEYNTKSSRSKRANSSLNVTQ